MQNITETEEHIVIEFTNSSGNKYAIGYPRAAGYARESMEAEITEASQKAARIVSDDAGTYSPVVWIANGDSVTSRAAIDTGIVGGYVNSGSGIIYHCELHFANTSGFGFTFIDGTSDTYFCSTPRPGNHFVYYNSEEPSIFGVK